MNIEDVSIIISRVEDTPKKNDMFLRCFDLREAFLFFLNVFYSGGLFLVHLLKGNSFPSLYFYFCN